MQRYNWHKKAQKIALKMETHLFGRIQKNFAYCCHFCPHVSISQSGDHLLMLTKLFLCMFPEQRLQLTQRLCFCVSPKCTDVTTFRWITLLEILFPFRIDTHHIRVHWKEAPQDFRAMFSGELHPCCCWTRGYYYQEYYKFGSVSDSKSCSSSVSDTKFPVCKIQRS